MASWLSECSDGDGRRGDGDDDVVEPLTRSDIGEVSIENNDGETEKLERAGAATDQGPQPIFGRWAVLACAIVNFGLGLSLPLATSTMFIEWQDTFMISRAHTVTVHSTAVGLLFGAAILPGYLMDHYGARFTVLLGCCLSSFGCLISVFATSINYLIVSVGILGGFGFCFIQLPSIPCVCQVFPEHSSIVVSVCTFGSAVLNMSMPYVYRNLINTYGWRGTFTFITAFCMHTSVFGLIMTSHLKGPHQEDCSLEGEVKKLESDISRQEGSLEVNGINEGDSTKQMSLNGNEMKTFSAPNDPMACTRDPLQENNRMSVLRRLNCLVSRIHNSEWKFLGDGMYSLIMFHIATCLSVQFSFAVIVMDFARTKGFADDSTGTFFLLVIYLSSLVARLLVGVLNLLPFLHSIIVLGVYGAISGFGMIMLGSASDYTNIVVFFGFQGFGVGGIVSIYPKCILDTESVSLKNYALALGLSCTWEGIFDFLVPILIGHAVDTQGSYRMILQLLGSISVASSIVIIVAKLYQGNHLSCRRSQSNVSNSSQSLNM